MFVCPALDFRGAYEFCARHSAAPGPSVKTGSHPSALGPMAAFGMNCRLRMAECIAQRLHLEHEIHYTASKLCILGFEALT
jgi:hypothetical protein